LGMIYDLVHSPFPYSANLSLYKAKFWLKSNIPSLLNISAMHIFVLGLMHYPLMSNGLTHSLRIRFTNVP
jgi:hypothetical protein